MALLKASIGKESDYIIAAETGGPYARVVVV
jgi:hypothetical protein